jgi:hypothetical protein
MLRIECKEISRPWLLSSSPAIRGVRTTPTRLEAVALHIAAGTLPPATDVKTIEACTVEGSAVRRINPAHSGAGKKLGARKRADIPSNGNSANVPRNTMMCSRQCRAPTSACSGESFAPCRKNSSTIAASASKLTAVAAWPRAGITAAKATVSRIAARNLSMCDQMERSKSISSLVSSPYPS